MITVFREFVSKEAGDGNGTRIFPELPRAILHAPRDNASCKGNPTLHVFVLGDLLVRMVPKFAPANKMWHAFLAA